MRKLLFIILCLLIFSRLSGQVLVNLRKTTVHLPADSVKVDSLSLVPGSLIVKSPSGRLLNDSLYRLDYPASLFFPDQLNENYDSVNLTYRVLPVYLMKVSRNKKAGFNRIDPVTGRPITAYRPPVSVDPFAGSEIMTNGDISRGLMVGNSRDPSLSSNLNLQLRGKINRDYMIEANLSDANIPIQPEGNTRQIQDFDRLYLKVFNERNEILGGDFFIESPGAYFLRMNKKVQGARVKATVRQNPASNSTITTSASGALVKGKYARNRIQGIEGNQGPYRLTGQNGETYIQVIAGSEKVYIDGVLLTRGEQYDYVIDYNTAELRFTAKRLITKDKRINVEFEYTEQSYARFLLSSNTDWKRENGNWYLNVFSEQDAKNQPLLQDLSDSNKALLGSVGDKLGEASVIDYHPVEFMNDRVLYRLTDTLVNGVVYDSILVYSINPDSAVYQAGFGFAGENKGDYIAVNSSANGQVYKWVAPEGGIQQGSYMPYTRLTAPRSKQVIVAGGREKISQRMEFDVEMAMTRNDLNTFSELDDSDNTGYGFTAGINRLDPLKNDSSWYLSSSLEYRAVGKRFDPVERFRPVEFERDWNISEDIQISNENFLRTSLALKGRDSLMANYQLEFLNFSGSYNAIRHLSQGKLYQKGWSMDWNGSYMNSRTAHWNSGFMRHNIRLAKDFEKIEIYAEENHEGNIRELIGNDRPADGSFRFQEYIFGLGSGGKSKTPWYLNLTHRTDELPGENSLQVDSKAFQVESGIDFRGKNGNRTSVSANYRKLEPSATAPINENNGQTVTARIDENFQLAGGAVVSRTFYEIGSGLERKMEYSYIEVPSGQGYYTWTDYNQNGIKELDEFEPAHFRDQANFIRVFRPGISYIPTYVNRFNQVINLLPGRLFKSASGVSKLASRFSNSLAFRTDNKNYRSDFIKQINPFPGSGSDTLVVSNNTQFRNTLSFNKSNEIFGLDYHFEKNQGQTLLNYGTDRRGSKSNRLVARLKPFEMIWITNLSEEGIKNYNSSFFSSKDYDIQYLRNNFEIAIKPGDKWQTGLSHEWRKESEKAGGEMLRGHRLEASVSYQMPAKGQLSLNLNYIAIKFEGEADSPVGYVMLQGFRPGNNGLLNLSLRRKLNDLIQLDLSYEGRISEGSRIIHTGNIQVRAVF
jgi:hypothetical protein